MKGYNPIKADLVYDKLDCIKVFGLIQRVLNYHYQYKDKDNDFIYLTKIEREYITDKLYYLLAKYDIDQINKDSIDYFFFNRKSNSNANQSFASALYNIKEILVFNSSYQNNYYKIVYSDIKQSCDDLETNILAILSNNEDLKNKFAELFYFESNQRLENNIIMFKNYIYLLSNTIQWLTIGRSYLKDLYFKNLSQNLFDGLLNMELEMSGFLGFLHIYNQLNTQVDYKTIKEINEHSGVVALFSNLNIQVLRDFWDEKKSYLDNLITNIKKITDSIASTSVFVKPTKQQSHINELLKEYDLNYKQLITIAVDFKKWVSVYADKNKLLKASNQLLILGGTIALSVLVANYLPFVFAVYPWTANFSLTIKVASNFLIGEIAPVQISYLTNYVARCLNGKELKEDIILNEPYVYDFKKSDIVISILNGAAPILFGAFCPILGKLFENNYINKTIYSVVEQTLEFTANYFPVYAAVEKSSWIDKTINGNHQELNNDFELTI